MWPLIIRNLKLPKSTWVSAGIIVILILALWNQIEANRTHRRRLEVALESLKHPQIVEKVVRVNVAGPTRIITRIVERPTGEKETTTDESRFGEVEYAGEETESRPIGLDELVGTLAQNQRADRWLLGVSHRDWSPKEIRNYGAWAGYSFHNRFDALMGITKHDRTEFNLLAVIRF